MADQQGQSQDLGYERLGEAKLSLIDVVAQSVGFMGPVFSAAFIIPLIIGVNAAARGAGTSAPLAVLLAGVGVFALGWIVAQYAKRIHAAGSLYDYVTEGLGSTIGAASGWLYYGGTIILTTGLGVLLGWFVNDNVLPALEIDLDLPLWLWDLIFTALLFVVLYFGVQISTRVQLTLALISIAVVLVFFIMVIIDLGDANDFGQALDPSPEGGFSGVLFGVLYGVLIFVGFETAANLAEETTDPKRSIPRAVLGAVVLVSIFYLIAAYTEVAGFGFDLAVITSPEVAGAPLFALGAPGSPSGSELWLKVLLVVVFLDMLAVYVGAAVASTRGTFAMARDRRLPASMASVSSKYGTPIGAIVLLMIVQLALIAAAEFWDSLFALEGLDHYFALFAWCATFGGFALLVVYLLMSIGVLARLGEQPKPVGVAIAAVVGIAITGAAIWGSFYKVPAPTIWAPRYAVIWFVIGLVYMAIVKGREPASQALPDLTSKEAG
ncbi:MAG TPA: APC family permease [Actinomycetota bacterium]|nr:APC family permease [Actinomycetota bacterium]